MKNAWENMEYLTDAELECLIRETEQTELVPAAPDLQDLILEALEPEISVLKEPEERSAQEKVTEFKRYRFRVLTTVAAAVLLVFLLPKLEGLQQPESEFGKLLVKHGHHDYMMQTRYESKEEALNDSGILETILGGVTIFADNSRFNLFRE